MPEIHFFDVRYGGYGGGKHYRSQAKRLRTLSKALSKRMADALDKIADGAPEGDPKGAYEPAGSESTNDGLALAWTDEIRAYLFSHAQLDDGLRKIAEIIGYLSLLDNESYVEYLKRHAVGARAFGEITPTYGLLPACGFAEIDSLFPGAQFIFIMRDPVDRLWSQVRYRAGKAKQPSRGQSDLNGEFRSAMGRAKAIEQSSYHRTINRLESAIPRDRILYLFYERMTSLETGPAEVRRIEAALGLDPADIDPKVFSTSVNASTPAKLDPENEAAARTLFAPEYKFVQERFGLPVQWHFPSELS